MRFLSAAIGWSLASLAVTMQAQTKDVRPLTLQECVQLAMEHNFDVRIETYSPKIARFTLEATRAYYDPVLNASYEHASSTQEGGVNSFTGQVLPSTVSESDGGSLSLDGKTPWGMTYSVGPTLKHRYGLSGGREYDNFDGSIGIVNLSQPLLRDFLTDRNRTDILIARKGLKISEAALTGQMMATVNSVEQAYYDLIFAGENITVQKKAVELAERLLGDNRKRVEVGTMAPLEEKQAESQLASSKSDLLSAEQTYAAAQNALKRLITDQFKNWQNVNIQPGEKLAAMPEHFDVQESWAQGLKQRPELRQLQLDLEQRDLNLRYQRNQIMPKLNLEGGYSLGGRDQSYGGVWDDQINNRNPTYTAGVIFSMPLNNRAARTSYKIGKAQKEQAALIVKKLEQDIMVQIDDAIKVAETSFERVDSTKKAREYAEAALAAEEKKLENGKSTSFVVLQLQKDLTTARSTEIRALADYNKSLAAFAFTEGSTLEKHGLKVVVK